MTSSISKQLAILLTVICVIFGIGLYAVGNRILLNNFRLLETRMLALDMQRIGNLFKQYQRALEDRAIDNGGWDGTYSFIQDLNDDYIKEIFSPENFAIVKADVIALLSFDGAIIYGGKVDDGKILSLDEPYQTAFKDIPEKLMPASSHEGRGGFLVVGNKNYLIGTGLIQKSSRTGEPPIGIFLIGMELTEERLEAFRSRMKIDFDIERLNLNDPNHFQIQKTIVEENPFFMEIQSGNTISGHTILEDLSGKNHFMVTLTKEYDFLTQAKESLYLFLLWFVLLCFILFVSILAFFERKIFKRLKTINPISQYFDSEKRNQISGDADDDIGQMISSVNAILSINRILVDHGTQMLIVTDEKRMILKANRRAHQLLGWPYPTLEGVDIALLFVWLPSPESKETEADIIEVKLRTHYDDCFSAELYRGTVQIEGQRQIIYLLNDLSERKKTESLYSRNYYYDVQTLLPNRQLFLVRLKQNLRYFTQNPSHGFSLVLLDIDRFKMLCDNMSTQSADEVMNEVIDRIQKILDEYDGIGKLNRMTGDEFAILIPGQLGKEKIIHLAGRLRKTVAVPVEIQGKILFPNVCMGVLVNAQRFHEVSDILTRLNFALEEAKQKGQCAFSLYEDDQDRSLISQQEMLTLENEVREALDKDEIFAFFQPIINIQTDELVGFEVLMRWISPGPQETRMPAHFITIAEESGLISALDRKVIRQSLEALSAWNITMPSLYLSVNISIRDLVEPEFIDYIQETIEELNILPENLILEITENVFVFEMDVVNTALAKIKSCGIKIALDDFGRKYSSLHFINRLPIRYLKVGYVFTARIDKDAQDAEIMAAIIGLANSLNIDFIAQGIETTEQLEWLKEKGCIYGQGFYFSAALPRIEANRYIQMYSRRND